MKVLSLKASSLVENLVAMTIISLAIGMGMLLFIQLGGPGLRNLKLMKSQQLMSEYFRRQELHFDPQIKTPEVEGFYIESSLNAKGKNLRGLTLVAYESASGKIIYSRVRWFYVER
ncbi:MAG: hypothetical protein NXI09_15715 [Bacteroidetes bacterium]|nr:hypothetical protein [Bacteroidota bacterium]